MGIQASPISFLVSLTITFWLQRPGQEFQVKGSTCRKTSYYWYVYYISGVSIVTGWLGFTSWWRQEIFFYTTAYRQVLLQCVPGDKVAGAWRWSITHLREWRYTSSQCAAKLSGHRKNFTFLWGSKRRENLWVWILFFRFKAGEWKYQDFGTKKFRRITVTALRVNHPFVITKLRSFITPKCENNSFTDSACSNLIWSHLNHTWCDNPPES